MDTIFQLPLFTLVLLQLLLALGLLAPKSISLPIAQLLKKTKTNTAANSVVWTVTVVLAGLLVSSFLELLRGFERVKHADVREVVSTIDYLRAQLSCALCAFNLALLFLSRALGEALVAWNHSNKNLEAMQRQVKGLQAEYQRVTEKPKGAEGEDTGAAGDSEADALKKKVDKLIGEKTKLQEAGEAAEKAKAAAEASVTAMKSQLKGFDAEYDRVREENAFLKRKLAGHGDPQYLAEVQGNVGGKKDD
mmetsp:Transcript_27065/g.68798  ORF Transcript_27065/g.68798 Transcript_27065/m.68798 type:complete len:249 (-) Transcript_27065:83-829(-)|eukprot:CAMPEP_0202879186 /NCGR_PEP_ID=MMETSP1391-20130828/33285_1 /ASSEMBLY_ACC=CAM_ASM_000867 /TAXON_ID=1034604 /ORGANISM="Chlamydomonas leiostraca, Strain SAG 11-49" /LENGTH=248 /DNA_ID=CAMNT_0049561499 /DNA_START=54 /DNA_END=800 /DNA_ORIENTATION=-